MTKRPEQGLSDPTLKSASDVSPDRSLASHAWREKIGGKVVTFNELAKCGDEIWIEHAGQLYRLRKTKYDKLVLSK